MLFFMLLLCAHESSGSRTTRPVDNSARGQLGPYIFVADNSARTYRTTRPVDSIILNACLESKLIKY